MTGRGTLLEGKEDSLLINGKRVQKKKRRGRSRGSAASGPGRGGKEGKKNLKERGRTGKSFP